MQVSGTKTRDRFARALSSSFVFVAALSGVASSDGVEYGQPQNGFAVSLVIASGSFQDGPHLRLAFWIKNVGSTKIFAATDSEPAISVSTLDGTPVYVKPEEPGPLADPYKRQQGPFKPTQSGSLTIDFAALGNRDFVELLPGQAKRNESDIAEDLGKFDIIPGQWYRVWAVTEVFAYEKLRYEANPPVTVVSNTLLVIAPQPVLDYEHVTGH